MSTPKALFEALLNSPSTPRELKLEQAVWDKQKAFRHNNVYFNPSHKLCIFIDLQQNIRLIIMVIYKGKSYNLAEAKISPEDSLKDPKQNQVPTAELIIQPYINSRISLQMEVDRTIIGKFFTLIDNSPYKGLETNELLVEELMLNCKRFLGIVNFKAYDNINLTCSSTNDSELTSDSLIRLLASEKPFYENMKFTSLIDTCETYNVDEQRNVRCTKNGNEQNNYFQNQFRALIEEAKNIEVTISPTEDMNNEIYYLLSRGKYTITLGKLSEDYLGGKEYISCDMMKDVLKQTIDNNKKLKELIIIYQKTVLWIRNLNFN